MTLGKLILDRYRPLGTAGTGGFGTVQVAWDQRIQRKVAIKTIELTELDEFRASLPGAEAVAGSSVEADVLQRELLPWEDGFDFERQLDGTFDEFPADDFEPDLVPSLAHIPGLDEARTAAMLSDPSIVTVYDFEVRDRIAYLIMEYVEGLTLTELLRMYGDDLTLDEIAAIFDAVAGALEHAHGAGVLHLDIKPDNILINANGQVKVTDFGLATLADAAGLGTTGGGTIGYMPPEQMRREDLDARCDEWSLAAITYEMLAGYNPFIVPTLDEAEAAILDAELVLPSLCWEGLDEQIDDVVFFALDPDREERYATVADFAEEARKFLGDPVIGQDRLAGIVSDELGIEYTKDGDAWDDYDDAPRRIRHERRPHRPLSAWFTPRTISFAGRACAALLCGFVAAVSVVNMPFVLVQTAAVLPTILLAACAIGLLGALRPDIGGLVTFVLLAATLLLDNAPVPGVVLLVCTMAWWYFIGRKGVAECNASIVEPAAGAFGFGAFAPLVAGAYLRPAMAAGAALFAGVVALAMASFGSGSLYGWDILAHLHFARLDVQGSFAALVFTPSTWCVIGSWVVAAWIEAFSGTRLGRFGIWLGYALAVVALLAGASFATALTSGFGTVSVPLEVLVPVLLSAAMLMAVELGLRAVSEEIEDVEDVEEE